MLEKLQSILLDHNWKDKKIIVAVSGGVDSMVLADLLFRSGVTVLLAHCNFGLRGGESDGDEALVAEWAQSKAIPFTVKSFDTRSILAEKGGNLQETARDLRYTWFEALRLSSGFDFIATAHHLQDAVETMLMNLLKGTGIAGLHGILPLQGKIIRPLLPFTKEEISQYALAEHIPWREDSSNKKDDYLRNEIRHHLLPLAEQIIPNATINLFKNTQRLREAELLYNESIEKYRKKLLEQRNKDWYIPVLKLKHCHPLRTILWELVKPFHFSAAQMDDIAGLLPAETGRFVASATHRIIKNRNFLIITPLAALDSTHVLVKEGEQTVDLPGFTIHITEGTAESGLMKAVMAASKDEVYLDKKMLHFPLVIRPVKTGDYFYPLGMHKKKKKVSRFLIDQKVPLHEKQNIWVIESGQKIHWVAGMRLDDRCKLTKNTEQYLKLSLHRK